MKKKQISLKFLLPKDINLINLFSLKAAYASPHINKKSKDIKIDYYFKSSHRR